MTEERLKPEALAADLKALAHEKRIRLVHFLVEPHTLEEAASELGVARQTAHEHLQQLLEVGLVARVDVRPDGRPGLAFVAVPHRLFHVYEMLGKLGEVELKPDERVARQYTTETDPKAAAAPRENEMPRLIVVHGLRLGQTKLLSGDGPWTIGRDPHATLCLDYDPYVSARHAEVRRMPGGFALADLYASNGTFIDWAQLERGSVRRIENGALVRIGRTLIAFRQPVR